MTMCRLLSDLKVDLSKVAAFTLYKLSSVYADVALQTPNMLFWECVQVIIVF